MRDLIDVFLINLDLPEEKRIALLKKALRAEDSGGSDTEDDDLAFNSDDEEVLDLEIEAVEAEADAEDADQNEGS